MRFSLSALRRALRHQLHCKFDIEIRVTHVRSGKDVVLRRQTELEAAIIAFKNRCGPDYQARVLLAKKSTARELGRTHATNVN
jgi:hypothetical protein